MSLWVCDFLNGQHSLCPYVFIVEPPVRSGAYCATTVHCSGSVARVARWSVDPADSLNLNRKIPPVTHSKHYTRVHFPLGTPSRYLGVPRGLAVPACLPLRGRHWMFVLTQTYSRTIEVSGPATELRVGFGVLPRYSSHALFSFFLLRSKFGLIIVLFLSKQNTTQIKH